MGEIEDLRAELAAQQEQQELLKLKEELAKIKRENAALETKAGGAGGAPATPAAAPPKKKKSKKAKKAPSAEEAAELAALQKELAARAAKPGAADPKSDDAYVRRAYVGGLPYSSTEASVSSYFANACGEVRRVDLKDFDDTPGKFCGIAFVTFGDEDALQRALNLDGSAYEDDERCRLKGCAVANLRYHTDADTGNFRGFCHVEFEDGAGRGGACADQAARPRPAHLHSETAKKRPAEGGKGGKGGRGARRARRSSGGRLGGG
ncbi:RNA binding protein [Aureococcus anophagefferens]|uniref:RNA binding protein n=1 Tax=Aureococcus anophagefferens TaxID=44056 RepID=A0ABR1G9G1_AURAN